MDKVDPSVRDYIDRDDRYGHPSLAMPEKNYDGSVYYAGWLYQHASHIEVFLFTGRYQNNKITSLQRHYLEQYISMQFMEAYGEQDIIFFDYKNSEEIELFLKGNSFPAKKLRRTYSPTSIKNKTLLDLAIEYDDDQLAIQLFEAGDNVSPAVNSKMHIIHVVARNGLLHHVQALIAHAPELIHVKDGFNQTPLLWAASRGHADVVDYLIEQGADINLATQLPSDHANQQTKDNYSPLDHAINGGHASTMLTLIKAGAKANHTHSMINGKSLKQTIKNGDLSGVQLFIQCNNKALLNEIDKNGATPLHYAAYYGQIEIARYLIAEGADLNFITPAAMNAFKITFTQMTAIDVVLKYQRHDLMAVFLIEAGANISSPVNGEFHAIHLLARNGLLNHVNSLVERDPHLVHATDERNKTPLLWAASRGHHEIVTYLIAHGADINLATQRPADHANKQTKDNYSPLDYATKGGHTTTMLILIKAGAKANHTHTLINGKSLKQTIKNGDLSGVQLFIQCNNKALLNEIDKNGATPLHYAAYYGQIEIARYLIAEGADLNVITPAAMNAFNITFTQMTAIDIALKNQQHDLMAVFLIEAGAHISSAVNGEFHAIHLLARNGLLHHVISLVERDPQLVHARDEHNQTPLLWAASRGHDDVVAFLLTKGAEVNLATQHAEDHENQGSHHNYSPLDWAIEGDHPTTISILIKAGAVANHMNVPIQPNDFSSSCDSSVLTTSLTLSEIRPVMDLSLQEYSRANRINIDNDQHKGLLNRSILSCFQAGYRRSFVSVMGAVTSINSTFQGRSFVGAMGLSDEMERVGGKLMLHGLFSLWKKREMKIKSINDEQESSQKIVESR